MTNYRSLAWLGAVTACAVALAIGSSLTWSANDAVSGRGNIFVPSLSEAAGTIQQVKVQQGDETQTFTRKGEGFVDASGFPARLDAVRDLVRSAAALTIEEKKTADPQRLGELDLAAPGSGDGAGTKVDLIANDGAAVVSIIAGKQDYSVGGAGGGQYVRRSDDNQSYLVRGSVKLPYGRSGWFDTALFELDDGRIVRAALTGADPDVIVVEGEDGSLTLEQVPEGKVADDAKIARIAHSFGPLSFEDVRAAGGTNPADRPGLSVETEAGLILTIVSMEDTEDGTRWVRMSASGSSDEARTAARSLTERFDGFEFRLNKRTSEILGWTADDLTRLPES